MKKITEKFLMYVFPIILLAICIHFYSFKSDESINLNNITAKTTDNFCSSLVCTLWAGKTINVGNVEINNDGTNLYVKYYTNYPYRLSETHLYVTLDPLTCRQPPGQATIFGSRTGAIQTFGSCSTTIKTVYQYIITIPSDVHPGTTIYIQANATICGISGDNTAYASYGPICDPPVNNGTCGNCNHGAWYGNIVYTIQGCSEIVNFVTGDSTTFPSKMGNLTSYTINPNSISLTYSGTPPQFQVGHFIVDTLGIGYCRQISTVQTQGNSVNLTTTNANFAQAFRSANINKIISIKPSQTHLNGIFQNLKGIDTSYHKIYKGKRYTFKFKSGKPKILNNYKNNLNSYDYSWLLGPLSITITINDEDVAIITVDTLIFQANLNIEHKLILDWQTQYLKLVGDIDGFVTVPNVDIQILPITVPIISADSVNVLHIPGLLPPFPLGPLMLDIGFDGELGFEVNLSINYNPIEIKNTYNGPIHVRAGGEWNNGTFTAIHDFTQSITGHSVNNSGNIGISFSVGPYTKFGPTLTVWGETIGQLYLKDKLEADISYPPLSCSLQNILSGGADLDINLYFISLGCDYTYVFDSWTIFNGCGSCNNYPASPSLLSPSNNSTGQSITPTLNWNSTQNTTNYHLQISTSNIFNTTIIDDSTLTSTQYTISNSNPLNNNTIYYWRVAAKNLCGPSDWSSVWNFTTISGGSLTDGLKAYYLFNGNLLDMSGNGNNGTAVGGNFTTDRFNVPNSAFNLNNPDRSFGYSNTNLINCGNGSSLQTGNAMSISMWFNSHYGYVFGSYLLDKALSYEYAIGWDVEGFFALIGGGLNPNMVATNFNPAGGTWNHAAVTYQFPGQIKMYINGVLVSSNSTTQGMVPTTEPLVLGCRAPSGQPSLRYFDGKIDDIRIYNRELSDEEITELYQAPGENVLNNNGNSIGNIPKSFKLYANYPNPFNPVTKIKFDLPKDAFTKLIVYDVLGREVTRLVADDLKAGRYEYEWDASNIASGIYFYRIEAGGYIEVKKMVLIR